LRWRCSQFGDGVRGEQVQEMTMLNPNFQPSESASASPWIWAAALSDGEPTQELL
jgi:hypothetical protein